MLNVRVFEIVVLIIVVPIKATAFGFKLDNEVTKHPFIDDWYITTTDDGQARLELLSKILPQSGEARNKVRYKILRVRGDPGVMPASSQELL